MMIDLIGGLLDCMTLFPVAIIVLLAMLQNRKHWIRLYGSGGIRCMF